MSTINCFQQLQIIIKKKQTKKTPLIGPKKGHILKVPNWNPVWTVYFAVASITVFDPWEKY